MNGVLKAAWGLTAFVVVAGVAGWVVTGKAVFAAFIVLGVLTVVGAVVTGRLEAKESAARESAARESAAKERAATETAAAENRKGTP